MEGEGAPQDREAELLEARRAEAKLKAALRMCLTPEACERMANVRMANPDLYAAAVRQILAYAGKGGKKLGDAQVLALLRAMRGGERETKITFK
ncbi:MAG: DNA-binding protein [Candidatus ainarchaeum sp.]|nr:DNA-binding protein [Candidatus ainarchaeum sp.]MDD5096336.1 DNA-binding protein [Candidatus ainarchaeum sp.]